ncbi:MAG: cyclic pyranopterin monophosphate synthase MoaC [Proteobacteria bacterium]|jgi:cyclic pyranopterin phosphate synthase|nr:cyclic pyranopterin monophosphate synthase MoaC [Desulfocapsa sp.]MBU3943612.1 cyclic pyranopterin monophosphate synthase MoaC [Pseudomonadota bacterium]MCG2744331.1 cyclic pyranopterin monophosphate synthase MoaC [Desulfobacteraceae bacterium]MBU4027688.1 cyclic pyranopterin monophosphate synthase MoaC [Pseudomonadota bacterium]MBU4042775.1 cyclic pyranopterin monophosphate synthase MoaC [Pseudomonadota bacterium]
MSQVDRDSGFTHFDGDGNARMVDVSGKNESTRVALAAGSISMSAQAYALVKSGSMAKGDVLGVARLAGIMGAKKVDELIPLAHPLMITRTNVDFVFHDEDCSIEIQATVGICGKTGVEMEALTAVSLAALTIYDMCKAVDKAMVINNIRLLKKAGGKSGTFVRQE